MTMRIGRTLPPAAAPIPLKDILQALPSCFSNNTKGFCFEEEIKQEFGQRYCLLVSSGKAALVLILKALHKLYPERDEVLIPAFTCYSVPAAIKNAGLKIKLCDIGTDSLDFDKQQLREIVEADNRANTILCVLVTHLFGCPADFKGIEEIVGGKIPIVEDAAQAMGEEVGNIKMGTMGDVGFFSLGRGKALSTMEGGVIITSRDDLGGMIGVLVDSLHEYSTVATIKIAIKTILINILQKPALFWLPKNLPFLRLGETIYDLNFSLKKISSFQRKLARNWKKRLKFHRAVRITNIKFWQNGLPDKLIWVCREYTGGSMIRLPIFARTLEERNRLLEIGEKAGLGIMPAYPSPINKIEEIEEEFFGQQYPQAQDVCERLLTLPVHDFINSSDCRKIHNLLNHSVTSDGLESL